MPSLSLSGRASPLFSVGTKPGVMMKCKPIYFAASFTSLTSLETPILFFSKPISGFEANAFNAWGATIVDSLSTLLVMNLTREYSLARTHVRLIDFKVVLGERSAYGTKEKGATVPVFESIIRYLGGMLSAYDLSGGDVLMLERAEELAGWLMGAFE